MTTGQTIPPSCRAGAAAIGLAVLGLWVPGLGWGPPSLLAQAPPAAAPGSLPVELDDLHLILAPVTASGVTLRLRLDSGGRSVLFSEALQRLGLPPGATPESDAALPEFQEGAWIPGVGEAGELLIPVRPNRGEWPGLDGVLGLEWLEGRSWTLDYPGRSLLLREPGDLPLHGPGERLDLLWGASDGDPAGGVAEDGSGGGVGVPVVRIAVRGEALPAAIHTASGAVLTEAAVGAIGDLRATQRAITRVDASLFDEWRSQHPDWTVLEGAEAETGEPVMQVRNLEIASSEIPRLWVLRSNAERVEIGEEPTRELVKLFLGGDVLREFRLTMDFGARVAVFEPAGFP